MLRLLQLLGIDALVGFGFLFGVMVVVGGFRWSDVRDVLLHDAYRSFTFEGERIPGAAPGPLARLIIRSLSDPDDARLRLVPEVSLPGPALPRFDRAAFIDRELQSFAVFRAR